MEKNRKDKVSRNFCFKLITLFVLIPIFQIGSIFANDYASETKITIQVEEASLQQVFDEVHNQSEFLIVYDADKVDLETKVDVNVVESTVDVVLNSALKGTNLGYKILDRQIVVKPIVKKAAAQQEWNLTGTVKDDAGELLVGVNVSVQGTLTGTFTNAAGVYKVLVPEGSETLEFSFIGYATQIVSIDGRNNIDVVLEKSTTEFKEVVVTALGITKEERKLTYGVSQFSGEEISAPNNINLVNSLQGLAAGVEITKTGGPSATATSRIVIRGTTSISSNNQPLFVIDGIPIDYGVSGPTGEYAQSPDRGNDIMALNLEDFASVSILKGGAATALYGSRASNGVVLLVSKKGKSTNGLGIEYSTNYSVGTVTQQKDWQNEYGARYTYDGAGYNRYYDASGNIVASNVPEGNTDYEGMGYTSIPNYRMSGYSYGSRMDGRDTEWWDKDEDGNYVVRPYDAQPDNEKNMYQNTSNMTNNLNLSGGNEQTTFRFSMSNTQATGMVLNNTYDKTSLSTYLTHRFNNRLSMDFSSTYTKDSNANAPDTYGGNGVSRDIGSALIYELPRDYNPNVLKDHYKWADGTRVDGPSGGYNEFWWNWNEDSDIQESEFLRASGIVNFKINDMFALKATGSSYMRFDTGETINPTPTLDPAGNSYSIAKSKFENYTVQGWLTFQHQFTSDLFASGYVAVEQYHQQSSSIGAKIVGGLNVPGNFFLGNSKETIQGSGSQLSNERMLRSTFYNIDLEYLNSIFFTHTGRWDGNSTLTYADGSGSNVYYYPSASAAVVFTDLIESVEWGPLSFGKVRLSYAQTGSGTGAYGINDSYSLGSLSYYGSGASHGTDILDAYTTLSRGATINDPDGIVNEMTTDVEFGLDLTFFDRRLEASVDVYKRVTKDQIQNLAISAASGYSSIKTNVAEISNNGVEISLSGVPIKTNDFRWDVTVNWSRNRSMIDDLGQDIEQIKIGGLWNVDVVTKVGQEYGVIQTKYNLKKYYNYKETTPGVYDLDADGEKIVMDSPYNGMFLLDANGNYQTDNSEVREAGNMQASWLANMRNSMTWKGLTLSFVIDMKRGGDIVSADWGFGYSQGKYAATLPGRSKELGGVFYSKDSPVSWWDENWAEVGPDGTTMGFYDGILTDGVVLDANGDPFLNGENGLGGAIPAIDNYTGRVGWRRGLDFLVVKSGYIMLRNLAVNYQIPTSVLSKTPIQALSVGVYGNNLWLIQNDMPGDIVPEAGRNNSNGYSAVSYGTAPLVSNFGFNAKISF